MAALRWASWPLLPVGVVTAFGNPIGNAWFSIFVGWLAKVLIVRFGGARLNAGIEIYNALNANAVLTYFQTFSPAALSGPGAWLQPTQVMTPRFFKLTAQFDF